MTPSAFFPTPERVQSLLRERELVTGRTDGWVRVLPVSWDRRASISRRHYQVWAGDSCLTQVYVGRGIAPYYKRASQFHEACGHLTPRPEFLFESDGFEFYGREYIAGKTLEETCQAGGISPAEVENVLCGIQERLGATERPSTLPRLYRELDELAARLDRIEHFTALDRELLQRCVLPELKSRLSERKARTRWSNGDFIARNIILDASGKARLIDDEFASRTHFFEEDWVRIGRYSQLPSEVQELPRQLLGADYDTINLYSLLRQMALEAEMKPADELRTSLHWAVEQMLPLIDRDGAVFGRSVFLSRVVNRESEQAPRPPVATLFYAAGHGFDEEHAVSQVISENEWQLVQFALTLDPGEWHLRLDPADTDGLIELHSLEIRCLASGRTLYSSDDPDDLAALRVDGTATRLPAVEQLRLFSHGGDPQLILPRLSLPKGGPVQVEFWLHSQPLVAALRRTLPSLLRKMSGGPDQEAAARLAELQQQGARAALKEQLSAAIAEQDRLRSAVDELTAERDASIEKARAIESTAASQLTYWQERATEAEMREREALLLADTRSAQLASQEAKLEEWRAGEQQRIQTALLASEERLSRYGALCLAAESRAEGFQIELKAAMELMDEQASALKRLESDLTNSRAKLFGAQEELSRVQGHIRLRDQADAQGSLREMQWTEQMRWLANRMRRMQEQLSEERHQRKRVELELSEKCGEVAAFREELARRSAAQERCAQELSMTRSEVSEAAEREAVLRMEQQLCREKIDFLRHRTREAEEQLRDVYRSFSWRAMAPVRRAASMALTASANLRGAHAR